MKKLLLITGLMLGFTAVAAIKNTDLKDKFKKFLERDKVAHYAGVPAQGFIPCDEINSLSEQELTYMKDKAVLMAYNDLTIPLGSFDKLLRIRNVDRGYEELKKFRDGVADPLRLYNNIVYCQSMKNKA